jgi:hypothetical protein
MSMEILTQKEVKNWTIENTWDEIMSRFDEIEKIEFLERRILSFYLPTIAKNYKVGEDSIKFSINVDSYFMEAILKIGAIGCERIPLDFTILRYRVDKFFEGESDIEGIYKTKKEATIAGLNDLEEYIDRKEYSKDYQEYLEAHGIKL